MLFLQPGMRGLDLTDDATTPLKSLLILTVPASFAVQPSHPSKQSLVIDVRLRVHCPAGCHISN